MKTLIAGTDGLSVTICLKGFLMRHIRQDVIEKFVEWYKEYYKVGK